MIALPLLSLSAMAADVPSDEVYRIRIQNRSSGLIQVSTNEGRTYSTIGRVLHPANARITGFSAASYTPNGTVAAVAVHSLRIKTGQEAMGLGKAQMPMMFSIVPRQFAAIPPGYGGHIPRSSAVITDIYAGRSIFRNQSPYVGNPVFFERDRRLEPLPEDYSPIEGKTFVIVTKKPREMPESIEFDNRGGGKVTARYPGGKSFDRLRMEAIASVLRSVRGTGRYDGTTFTGVGAINTNHGGVITISTAPNLPPETKEGGPVETRGGFMIQPYFHVCEQDETKTQVMVIAGAASTKDRIEGTPPLFDAFINLSRYPGHPRSSYRAQVRIDGGEWENVPEIVGKVDDAFTPGYLSAYFARKGRHRDIKQGVTGIRLVFPRYDPQLMADDLTRETADYTRRAIAAGAKARKGAITLAPLILPTEKSFFNIYVDGEQVYTSNRSPYQFDWDSRTVPNGLHSVEIEAVPASGGSPTIECREVVVGN